MTRHRTAALVGNTPGQRVVPGSMGRPLPGFEIALLDADGRPADEGELCVDLRGERPVGLLGGYRDDPAKTAEAMRGGFYHTGDVARRDPDGWITYVGRNDDVFKASDYRLSPFGAMAWRVRAETLFSTWRIDWKAAIAYERYESNADWALGKVAVANPGLVSFHLLSVSLTARF